MPYDLARILDAKYKGNGLTLRIATVWAGNPFTIKYDDDGDPQPAHRLSAYNPVKNDIVYCLSRPNATTLVLGQLTLSNAPGVTVGEPEGGLWTGNLIPNSRFDFGFSGWERYQNQGTAGSAGYALAVGFNTTGYSARGKPQGGTIRRFGLKAAARIAVAPGQVLKARAQVRLAPGSAITDVTYGVGWGPTAGDMSGAFSEPKPVGPPGTTRDVEIIVTVPTGMNWAAVFAQPIQTGLAPTDWWAVDNWTLRRQIG